MSAPRLPKSENYWKNKGIAPVEIEKNGKIITTYKNVMLYTHDDLDGIMSAQLIKKELIKKGYNIIGYGIVNYQEGWKYTTLRPDVINVSVDFAGFHESLHVYVDHHMGNLPEDRKDYAVKTHTGSAFEGIALQYGIAHDSLTLHPIDMVDSAKYKFYGVDISTVIDYNWKIIKSSDKKKLTFTGMINQFIKRADHSTLIEVIHNCAEPSIFAIYLKLKEFYGGNNLWRNSLERKDFLEDGMWRINTMKERTRGNLNSETSRKVFKTQEEFLQDCWIEGKISLIGKGYQVIGNLAFIPSGTWANAIRARAIIEQDIRDGLLPKDCVDFILLQYGNTLQMVAYDNINEMSEEKLPKLKDGSVVKNIGKYMENLLLNFKEHLNYTDPSTYITGAEDEITLAGGHGGIGSISNICGKVQTGVYSEMKYLDLFKNKIIQDISNCDWKNLKIIWTGENDNKTKEPLMDWKVLLVENIRTSGEQKSAKEIELENTKNVSLASDYKK